MSREVAAEPGLTYEAVLEAVQESSRGRWFLNEFKSRSSGLETGPILGAIARLESRMESLAQGGGAAAAELAKVRQAIAATRQDILKASGAPGLSQEGQLFSHLAELARKTMAEAGASTHGKSIPESIAKALRLVDQIDTSLNGGGAAAPAATEKFFHRDKDLFQPDAVTAKPALIAPPVSEPAPAPAPDPASPREKPNLVEAPALGARLTIHRNKPAEAPKQEAAPPAAEPRLAAALAVPPAVPPTSTDSAEHGHPRIVIIRRKPEDMQAPAAAEQMPAEDAA
jgi:hypothetical protein